MSSIDLSKQLLQGSTIAEKKEVSSIGRLWSNFKVNKLALVGGIIILLEIFIAIFAPYLAPFDPAQPDFVDYLQGPSAKHWMGTDTLGRDVLSRLIYGARVSLLAGLISVSIALALGVPLGLISGYYQGFVDEYIIMRITDAMLALPSLVLALALGAVLGPGLRNAMIAIGIIFTPRYIRLVRGEVLAAKEKQYVEACRALGMKDIRILFKHILPNILSPIMVQATLSIAAGIITEAGLSYLGLGTQPPTPSWGSMLSVGQGYLDTAPWIALAAGSAIFISVLSFNLFGDGLRDMLDPKNKR